MQYFARIAKANGRVIEVWSYEENASEDKEQSKIPINREEPRGAYDLDITNHAQKDEITTSLFYNGETNTFTEYPKGYVPPEPEPSLEEQLAALKEENQTLMLAIAEQYEKQLAAEENQQIIMLAIAELYETQTSAAL